MLSLPLVQAIEISGHNRNRACGTLPTTSLYFGFAPQLQRMVALSEKASHGPAGKSIRGPASSAS